MKIGQRIVLSFFAIILLVIIVLQIILSNQKNFVKQYIIHDIKHFTADWQLVQAAEVRSLAAALERITQDEALRNIYQEKNREKLYAYTQHLWESLNNHQKVDVLNFILPDGQCFLRINDKNLYGDIIILPNALKNNPGQDIVFGITADDRQARLTIFKPYYSNKVLIGYLQISQPLDIFLNQIQDIAGAKIVFVAKETALNQQVKIDQEKKIVVLASTLPQEYEVLLDQGIEKIIEDAAPDWTLINKKFSINNQQFALCASELKDINGEKIGAVLGFLDITPYLDAGAKVKFFSLLIMLFLCVIVAIVGLVLMNSILMPIIKLTQAVNQVSKGNLDVLFREKTRDEIGFLGQAFNQMVQDLKLTTTSRDILNKEVGEREAAEKALRYEKERAERYFDLAGVMFIALNHKGEITLVNKKSCEVLEAKEPELIGKNWFKNFAIDADKTGEVFNQLMSGSMQNIEYYQDEIKTAEGKIKRISWHNSIIKDVNGSIIGIFASGQDITDKLKSEQLLKASEEKYKNLSKDLEQGQEATLNILEDLQEAKSTLEVSRQNFINIVEKSTDSVFIVDQGIVRFANNSAVVLLGRSLDQIIDKPLGFDIVKAGIQETSILRADGSYRVVKMRAVDTEWAEKTMMLLLLHDMTEQKQAEDSLRVAAQEWRVTFDSIGHGLALLNLDGIIVRCNKALSDFVHKPYSEIIGHDCHALIHGQNQGGNCPINETLATKQRSIKIIKKEDNWLSLSVDPLFNDQNELIGMIHSVIDITEQKMIEQKLREYTDYVENIIETAQTFIIGFDLNLSILSINSFAEKLTGYKRDDMLGNNWLELLIPQDYRDEVIQVLNNCLDGERVKGYEIPILNKDNKEIIISWDSAELRDADGKITGIVVMGYDVSQRKDIEKVQRLAQLGTLVSHMAHEVNNPLMVISGRAQLSLMEEIGNEEVRANLDIVMKECQRAKEIIQRLLRFSRPSKGELKQTAVNASVEEVVNLVEHQFGLNNVFFKKDYALNLPLLLIDEKQIHEVFINLLTNAQDAIHGEGTIAIKTEKEGKFIKISFTDSGEGITKEVLDKIFDPFFTTKKKGTGLGLSICYSIIKAHNGNLIFESVPGQGTTAVILLPYMQENADV